MTLSTASIGLYSIAATLFWGRVFFGVPLEFAHPSLFALALPVTVVGLGLLGLVLASTFVLYRHANAFSNLLEYPVWLVTGLLVPLSLLPGWIEWLSWVLAPTWGMEAVRNAALGGEVWPDRHVPPPRRPSTSGSAPSSCRTSSGSPASARPSR